MSHPRAKVILGHLAQTYPHFLHKATDLDASGPPGAFTTMLRFTLIPTALQLWGETTNLTRWHSPFVTARNPAPATLEISLSSSDFPMLSFTFISPDRITAEAFIDDGPSCPHVVPPSHKMTLNPTIPTDIIGWLYNVHGSLNP